MPLLLIEINYKFLTLIQLRSVAEVSLRFSTCERDLLIFICQNYFIFN